MAGYVVKLALSFVIYPGVVSNKLKDYCLGFCPEGLGITAFFGFFSRYNVPTLKSI